MVPEGWEEWRLGSLLEFKNGFNTDKSNYGYGTPFINVSEVLKHSSLSVTRIPGLVNVSEKEAAANAVKHGDILFNRTSETPDEVGFTSVYLDNAPVVFVGFVIRGRPIGQALHPEFAQYALRQPAVRFEIIRRSQGAVRSNIGQGELSKVPIQLPPLPEQRKITEILSTWDEAIEKTEALLATARRQKRALMQQLLTGKRRFPEFEGQPWKEVRLGDVADIISGPAFKSQDFSKDGFRLVRGSNVKRGYLDWSKSITVHWINDDGLEKYRLQSGDIVVAMDGYVGRSHAIISDEQEKPMLLVQRVARVRASVTCSSSFLYACISSHEFYQHCERMKTATGIAHITMKDIGDFRVPKLTGEEQGKIGAAFDACNNEIRELTNDITKLRTEKKALMQQLLTGKQRVVV